jgi:NAD+ synthase (glutamine-hydrolysing)
MKIAIAQLNPIIGDLEGNMLRIVDAARMGRSQGADLVVFPELSLTGYPPEDLLQNAGFLRRIEKTIGQLAAATASGFPAMIVGAPTMNTTGFGKMLHNSALFLADGKVIAVRHKTLLPDYDIFDEARYFEPAQENLPFSYQGKTFALMICEDAWNVTDPAGLDPAGLPATQRRPYKIHVLEQWKNGPRPDVIINISASPYSMHQAERRRAMVAHHVAHDVLTAPFVYVNQVGGNTGYLFDGGSMVVQPNGEFLAQLPWFEEGVYTVDLALPAPVPVALPSVISHVYEALVLGIRDFFKKNGFQKAVLGLSGGIDSAVTAVLAVDALGKDNVTGVLLPSPWTSDHAMEDGLALVENLGIQHVILPIEGLMNQAHKDLMTPFGEELGDLTAQNLQARLRGILLMAFSNQMGFVLLNTTNKSEAAVGYGTLYGDMCGSLAVLGDVYKTKVWELAKYINRDKERIPQRSITKAPSAELKPGQVDQDNLPPYPLLDALLEKFIDLRWGQEDLVKAGYDPYVVQKVLNLVNRHEFKRFQMAPVLRVTTKAFGYGRKMPLTARFPL